eukprot:TRINITY_DN403_c0_g1_i2.p1 TRINITY_DN403_c0_g1~~TRINITY_DN403_c0_g1_i2.p1  ORF type:complete len:114 (+),score=11.17 TRINITY_DN403_c0_g1_i2:337-678(+)
MGKLFLAYLEGPRIYTCSVCKAHLAENDKIISKSFQGRHGRAYLFHNVVNVSVGPTEERVLITGLHTVADLFCISCQTVVGWKYEMAYEESQKYKEGKFIIEKEKMKRDASWK